MKQIQHTLTIACHSHGFTNFTTEINKRVHESGVLAGLVNLFLKDIGCSLSIQENTNKDTLQDMEILITHAAPDKHKSHHSRSNEAGDAHEYTRMALTNMSLTIPVQNGRLVLGPWQAICLYEHHSHAKNRRIFFHMIGS